MRRVEAIVIPSFDLIATMVLVLRMMDSGPAAIVESAIFHSLSTPAKLPNKRGSVGVGVGVGVSVGVGVGVGVGMFVGVAVGVGDGVTWGWVQAIRNSDAANTKAKRHPLLVCMASVYRGPFGQARIILRWTQ